MAYTQAFGQAAAGTGDMAGLFIPAPDAMAGSQPVQPSPAAPSTDPNSPLDRLVAAIGSSPIQWRDGLPAKAPALSPSNDFLWAVSSNRTQAQTPALTNQFQQVADPSTAQQPAVDPSVLAEALNKITVALDSAPPPALTAHGPVTAATDINKIDQQTTAHADKAADGHAAVQDLQATIAKAGAPSASGPFGIAAGGAVAGPLMGAVANAAAPGTGPAVQALMAGFDAARIGAGSFGATGHTSAYADQDGAGYSGASASAPGGPAAPQKPLQLPGLLDHGRVTLAGASLTDISTLRVDGMDMRQLSATMGAINSDARQMKDTMNKIATQGVQVGLGQAADLTQRQAAQGGIRLNDNGTGAVAFQINRSRAPSAGMG